MRIFLFVIVLAVSYCVGVFGFCQIIGSLQNIRNRGGGLTALTIAIWAAVLVGEFFLAKRFFANQIIAFYVGTGFSFISSLGAGKIQ